MLRVVCKNKTGQLTFKYKLFVSYVRLHQAVSF